MSDVTRILDRAQQGIARPRRNSFPGVHEQLRTLAAQRMAQEAAGQTLQPTALVHEAWLKLTGASHPQWNGRGHSSAPRPRPCGAFSLTAPAGETGCGMDTACSGWIWTRSMSPSPPTTRPCLPG